MKKETRGRKKKQPKDKVVPLTIYVLAGDLNKIRDKRHLKNFLKESFQACLIAKF